MPPLKTLAPGNEGSDVVSLQKWLISQGFPIPAGATGYYGDQTKKAVAAWQQANGIDTKGNPGYYGPISHQFIQNANSPAPVDSGIQSQGSTILQNIKDSVASGQITQDQANTLSAQVTGAVSSVSNPIPTAPVSKWDSIINSDPLLSAYLKDPEVRKLFDASPDDLKSLFLQSARSLQKGIEDGKVINPNIEITPEKLKEFYTLATSELDPYYKEQMANYQEDLNTSISRLSEDYNKTIERTKDPFRKTLETQAGTEAEQGTVYSSGRQDRLSETVNQQQQQLSDVFTAAQRKTQDLGTNYERQMGSSAARSLNLPGITSFNATETGITPGQQSIGFTPSGNSLIGTLPGQREVAIRTRASGLEKDYRSNRILNTSALNY
jgi:peptidoglycan hydrolase-like protein with peptidoglycan-binding domain